MNESLVKQSFETGFNDRLRHLMLKQAISGAGLIAGGVGGVLGNFAGKTSPGIFRSGWTAAKGFAAPLLAKAKPVTDAVGAWGKANPMAVGAMGGALGGGAVTRGLNSYADARRRDAIRNTGAMGRLGLAFQMLTSPDSAIKSMHL